MHSSEDKFVGMTTNERLFSAGILDQFDHAGYLRDRATMIALLTQVASSDLKPGKVPSMVDDMLSRWDLFFSRFGPAT